MQRTNHTVFLHTSNSQSSIVLQSLEFWERRKELLNPAIVSVDFQAIMQETLTSKKSHLVILFTLRGNGDTSPLVIIHKPPCSSKQELVSSLTFAFDSKLVVVDLRDLLFRNDIVWDLIGSDWTRHLLKLGIEKLDMVEKFPQLHTLTLDSCSSLVNLEEGCFDSIPRLRRPLLCGARVIHLRTSTISGIFTKLSSFVKPQFINERRYITFDKIGKQVADESLSAGAFTDKIVKSVSSIHCPVSSRQENLKIEVSPGRLDVEDNDESPTSVLEWDSTESDTHISSHPSTVDFKKQCSKSEYQEEESIVSILHMREVGTNGMYPHTRVRKKQTSSCRKSQSFYTKSLCATKFSSSGQPLLRPITNMDQRNRDGGKRYRPRQFEYHPSNASLMAVGTLDDEVVLLNPETGNIFNHISSNWSTSSVMGLCWLKNNPSKLLVGSDNGLLRLYDINHLPQEVEYSYFNSSTYIFEDFEHLTSVHVNSTEDRFLTSGYSKKVAIYDICSGKCVQLFTDMHSEPINVAKFANHSPNLLVTSSFDRYVKMWDLRQNPVKPCYAALSSRGNVMACFSPDDLYVLVSAVDNEVKQLLAVDGTSHTKFDIVQTGSYSNYTRSYYMNGRDYIVSGSSEEPVVRVCCAQTGKLIRNICLEDDVLGSSIFVQSLRSDPFRHFHLAVLAAYVRPSRHWEIINVNLLSSSHHSETF